jgi:hypothetical protein
MLKQATMLLGCLSLAGILSAEDVKKPEKAEKLDLKALHVHPYCSTEPSPLLDPKMKGIFDELKVSVNSSTDTRFHITGKKKNDTGKIGDKVVYHLGKLVTTPAVSRTGTILVQLMKGKDESAGNYVALTMQDDTVKATIYKLSEGVPHKWKLDRGPETTTLVVMENDEKEAIRLSAPTSEVREYGFAATVRSVGDNADVLVTFD